jgi:hypothetical protein
MEPKTPVTMIYSEGVRKDSSWDYTPACEIYGTLEDAQQGVLDVEYMRGYGDVLVTFHLSEREMIGWKIRPLRELF